jgi:hypothetical protein
MESKEVKEKGKNKQVEKTEQANKTFQRYKQGEVVY